ncbi:acyl-CoA dehydrogenase family protein [Pollutimonas bauzanensis]|uniref:Medium-chain specific acyl-CoA dehydrogenase, mitochondrial n=1 Tax=Pollutimonas bauzanensis TaxID=658167 RepID=A0A1M6A630_9BURK|nr:acyl-CoA dehydrogenase family protein [Pollutimonas bauzanensis]SHI31906.1 acyl-CoA dehydrogenase [Pollutimonas bauzanensis]
MDFELPEELRMLGKELRRFVDREVIPIEREAYSGPEMKPEIRARLSEATRKMGLWHFATPTEYGGQGLGMLARVVVWEQMGRTIAVPGRKAQIFGPEVSPTLYLLNEEQKRHYLLPVIRGEKTDCFAQTEADAGGDPAAMRTTAVREGDDYILSGGKRFITSADTADFAQVMAKTDAAKGSRGGISAFLVDMSSPGVKVLRKEATMMDDEPCDVAFDDVRVPAWKRIGAEGEGFKVGQAWINQGRIRHGARALGVIERCLELAAAYAKQRITFGKPLADRQAIQWMLVDSYIDLQALRLMVYRAAWKYDRGEDIRYDAYMVKIRGDRLSFQCADHCLQIHGGAGLTRDLPIEKFWRDQRSMMITEGPEEVLKSALARRIFEVYA